MLVIGAWIGAVASALVLIDEPGVLLGVVIGATAVGGAVLTVEALL